MLEVLPRLRALCRTATVRAMIKAATRVAMVGERGSVSMGRLALFHACIDGAGYAVQRASDTRASLRGRCDGISRRSRTCSEPVCVPIVLAVGMVPALNVRCSCRLAGGVLRAFLCAVGAVWLRRRGAGGVRRRLLWLVKI